MRARNELTQTLPCTPACQEQLKVLRRQVVENVYASLGPREDQEQASTMREAYTLHLRARLEHEIAGRLAYWQTRGRREFGTFQRIVDELAPEGQSPKATDYAWLQGWVVEYYRERNGAKGPEEWVTR
jgi:hypothetical protein